MDFRPFCILRACNPRLANDALQLEKVGTMLPCNVVVQQSRPMERGSGRRPGSLDAGDQRPLKAAQKGREKLARMAIASGLD